MGTFILHHVMPEGGSQEGQFEGFKFTYDITHFGAFLVALATNPLET